MEFIKRILKLRGIHTENVNMIVAILIFIGMILYGVFKDIVIKKIKEKKKGTYVDTLSKPGAKLTIDSDTQIFEDDDYPSKIQKKKWDYNRGKLIPLDIKMRISERIDGEAIWDKYPPGKTEK